MAAGLALGSLIGRPGWSAVVYLDTPTKIAEHTKTEEAAAGLDRSLRNGFDSGVPFVEVARSGIGKLGRPKPLHPEGSMEELLSTFQGCLDWKDSELARLPAVLRRVRDQGPGHIAYGPLEPRKAGVFVAHSPEAGRRRIVVQERLNKPGVNRTERCALASVVAHEGTHALQFERGDMDSDPVEDEVEAHFNQGTFLLARREGLLDAARAALAAGDLMLMKFYANLIDIVDARAAGRPSLERLVRRNYRSEDLH